MIFLCWGKKYYLIQNICAERVRDREREREISLSLSFSRKSFPIIKNCGFCLIMGRKLIRVTQINLRAAYSCLLKPGFPPIRSIRPHVHAPISPSVIFSYKGPFINDVTQGGGWGCKAKCEIMA